ncbi:glycosyltransferase family 39 protein [Algoriphagus namhaensis]
MSPKELNINPWIVMAVFTLLVGPFALSFHMHYPDEMYYTDAAVKMLQNGDYLNTYLGNGELRFRKPIFTYWVVLAGFKLFGVSAFASRIFFLLAGAATVGLTYQLARLLFDRKVAGLSALIIAANPVLIFAATRSIPDVLLGLFMTAAALGFAGIMRYGDAVPKKYLWLLYLSLALAFETKGLPAVALGGIGIAYVLLNPWKQVRLQTLLHAPSLLLALGIGVFWFVAMWWIHGPTYIDSFFADQVGSRVSNRWISIFQNGFKASYLLFLIFIPWILFVFPRLGSTLRNLRNENGVFLGFALLWGLSILGMGALTGKFYERYHLPVAPVLGVLLGWILVRNGFMQRLKFMKISAWVFLILNGLVAVAGLYINLQLGSSLWIYLQLFFGLIVFIYLVRLTLRSDRLPKVISYSFLLIFFFLSTVTAKISLPDQGEQVHDFVVKREVDRAKQIGFIGNLHVSSKIRISLGPEYFMTDISGEKKPSDDQIIQQAESYEYLIIEDKELERLILPNFERHEAAVNWDSKKIPTLLLNLNQPDFESILLENGKVYYWLQRKGNQ